MNRFVVIDTCILGKLTNPKETDENRACREWADDLQRKGTGVVIPEIADYELRRILIQANRGEGIAELDRGIYRYDPITTEAMRLASRIWSDAKRELRHVGIDDLRIDADVILCAQAWMLAEREDARVIIATDNIKHFWPFVDVVRIAGAMSWRDIDHDSPEWTAIA